MLFFINRYDLQISFLVTINIKRKKNQVKTTFTLTPKNCNYCESIVTQWLLELAMCVVFLHEMVKTHLILMLVWILRLRIKTDLNVVDF